MDSHGVTLLQQVKYRYDSVHVAGRQYAKRLGNPLCYMACCSLIAAEQISQ